MKNNHEFTKDVGDSDAASRKGLIAGSIETAVINVLQTMERKISGKSKNFERIKTLVLKKLLL